MEKFTVNHLKQAILRLKQKSDNDSKMMLEAQLLSNDEINNCFNKRFTIDDLDKCVQWLTGQKKNEIPRTLIIDLNLLKDNINNHLTINLMGIKVKKIDKNV